MLNNSGSDHLRPAASGTQTILSGSHTFKPQITLDDCMFDDIILKTFWSFLY